MATMTIGGLWHGASWNFVLWGVGHGVALVIHKLFFKGEANAIYNRKWSNIIGVFLTFHFVAFMWIFFRAIDFIFTL